MKVRRVCVFCGSNPGARPAYTESARALGRAIGASGRSLVYGGGNVGLMGAIADAALEAGAEVHGVIPESLRDRELAHQGLTELRVVHSMHERKATMAGLSDAFVMLPGGFGTYEEFCEVITWAQLGIHSKPCGVLEVEGFFAALLAHFDHACAEGFVSTPHRAMIQVASTAAELLDALERFAPVASPKWIQPEET